MDDRICLAGMGVLALIVVGLTAWAMGREHALQTRLIRLEALTGAYQHTLRYYADDALYLRRIGTDNERPIDADGGAAAREVLGLEDALDRVEGTRERYE